MELKLPACIKTTDKERNTFKQIFLSLERYTFLPQFRTFEASNLPKPLRSEIRVYIDPPPLRGSAPTDFPVGTEGADKQDNFAAARPQESINPAGHSRIRRLERPLPAAILKPFPAKRLNVSPSGHLPDSSAFLSFGRDRAAGIESIEDHVQRFYFPFGRVVKIFMANRESGKWDFLLSLSLSRCFSLPCLLPTKKNSISTDLRLLALSLFKVFFKL